MAKIKTANSNNRPLERRSYEFEVRAQDQDGKSIITGRPIVYGDRADMHWFEEFIDQGALDKTDLKDVRFLVNHNRSMIPLARSRNNNANSTMRLTVDSQGLAMEVELDTGNNAEARALYSAVSRGDISGMSMLFGVRADEWQNMDSDYPTRHIKDISTVVEVSAVTFPAYGATEIEARSEGALESARSLLDSVRQQREQPVETGLELAKAKFHFMEKLGGI